MTRLSSNLTIFLKIFIPIFYIVFFGSFLLGSLLVDPSDAPFIANPIVRLIFATVFLVFVIILYFTFIKLKRIDADEEYVYINNYMKTFRYPWTDIKKVSYRNYGLFSTMRIHFKGESTLGKRVSFLPAPALVKAFIVQNPELYDLLRQD